MVPRPAWLKSVRIEVSPVLTLPPDAAPMTVFGRTSPPLMMLSSRAALPVLRRRPPPAIIHHRIPPRPSAATPPPQYNGSASRGSYQFCAGSGLAGGALTTGATGAGAGAGLAA